MSSRRLNWYGWSIYTIAAVYETDAAAREYEEGLINVDYIWSAWAAEQKELELDNASSSS